MEIDYEDKAEITLEQRITLKAIDRVIPISKAIVYSNGIYIYFKGYGHCVYADIDEDGKISGEDREEFLKCAEQLKKAIDKYYKLNYELIDLRIETPFLVFESIFDEA